jgi:perosamine synthetase
VPVGAVLPSVLPRRRNQRDLSGLLEQRLGIRHSFFVSSGRAALAVLLEAMQRDSNRREVIVPAYTCFSVPSAVARSGLVVRLCDVSSTTLDFDMDALGRLDLAKALCMVPSGLYGLPGDLAALEPIAKSHGAFLVDDAAQCLGASQDGRPSGTLGDAGFYSLGRGKGITTMGGGILATTRDDLARRIDENLRKLRRPPGWKTCAAIGSSLLYSSLLKPSRFWLLDRLPFLGLGLSVFDPSFSVTRLSTYQRRLAARLLPLVDSYNQIRRAHAEQLRAGIEGADGIEIPRPAQGSTPVYLRFPILARDESHRARMLQALRHAGISASASYPTSIEDIPGVTPHLAAGQEFCPKARSIAARILTLPTHPGVTARDVDAMITIVRGAHGRAEALR